MAAKSSKERVRKHRQRLREQGLRPVQFWVPDVTSEEFKAQAHRESVALAQSPEEEEDQGFVDAVSDTFDE
jgi:hypothetical protein